MCRAQLGALALASVLAAAHASAQTFSIDRTSPSYSVFPARLHDPDSVLQIDPTSAGEDVGGFGPRVNVEGALLPRHNFGPFGRRDVDAISSNHGAVATLPANTAYFMIFSIRRDDTGDFGTCTDEQFARNQEAGDMYRSTDAWRPVPVAGPHERYANGASNECYLNQHDLDEVPTVPPNAALGAGTPLDNLDGFDFNLFNTSGTPALESRLYYSVSFATDADFCGYIFTLPPGWAAAPADPLALGPVFATREQLRLTSGDDLDALVVYDANGNGVFEPGDAVLLSLMEGSTSLGPGWPYHFAGLGNPADIFFVYRTAAGTAAVSRMAFREHLGFSGGVGYADIDALEVLAVSTLKGDMNCDGVLNNFDIDPFVLAITDPAAWQAAFPLCLLANGDMNDDGSTDNFDIDPFIDALIP
ncbi:MAG: hypothetical protein AB7Q17_14370 [Phycisphaerae bacterium]